MSSKEIVKVLNNIYDEIMKGSKMYVFVNDVMLTNSTATLTGENVRFEVKKPDTDTCEYWLYVISGTAVITVIMSSRIHDIRYEVVK